MAEPDSPAAEPAGTSRRSPLESPLLVAVLLGAVAVVVGLVARATITGRFGGFGNDAGTIREIMTSPFSAMDLGYGSYSVIAHFYGALGMEDAPTAASVFGAVIGSTALGIVLVRVGGVHAGRISLVLALATPVLIGLYQATYTKEILISLGMIAIVLMPMNLLGEIVVVAALALLGTEYRTYWSIVAVVYVVLRLLLARRTSLQGRRISTTPWRVVRILALLGAVAGLAVWIGTGEPADYFRTAVNEGEARQAVTGSIITRFIELPEPLGGMVNVVLTILFFIVPLPLAAKFSPYYLVIGIVFAAIWVSAVYAASAAARAGATPADRARIPRRHRRMMARFAAVPLSFLVVQGLFEPDWGSALRHATPMVPLIVGAVALNERYRPKTEPTDTTEPTDKKRTLSMTASTTPQETSGASGQNYLATYLGYLRKSFWMLLVGALVGGLIGWGASALMTKDYTATSQLYVGAANTGNSADAYRGTLLSQSQVGTYAEIATSRALGERVAEDLGLDQSPAEVASMLTAGANRDTVILNINAVATDAGLARDVANSAATELTSMVAELNTTASPGGESSAPQLAPLNDALTPDAPSSPKTLQNAGIGILIGLVVGLAAAIIRGMTDRRIRDQHAITDIVGAPSVGSISTNDNLSGGGANNSTETAGSHVLDFSAAPVIAAEQFRELRTNLRFLDVDNPPTVIAVTSGMPGEGKSTLATNLALALADDGERVCLVDADLRRPRVADYLDGDLQSEVGLSTVLSGAADVDDIVQDSGRDSLSVITSGPQPPNPAELLGSQRFRDLLAELDSRYDYVVVDASPVIPVTDAALVASAADGIILAVRHGNTTVDQLTRTTTNLNQVSAHILGTVFTMTPKSEGKGYYRNGYGYGYGNTARAVSSAKKTGSTNAGSTGSTGPSSVSDATARETVGADR